MDNFEGFLDLLVGHDSFDSSNYSGMVHMAAMAARVLCGAHEGQRRLQ